MGLETTNFTMTINKSKLIFKNTNIIATEMRTNYNITKKVKVSKLNKYINTINMRKKNVPVTLTE